DGCARILPQDVLRKDREELVAPDDAAKIVDDADAIAIAIETDAEAGVDALYRLDQILQIFRDRRIGVMVREIAVDLIEQQHMPPRQLRDDLTQRLAGGAVATVPDDAEILARCEIAQKA